jgi:hypothetical protein
MSYAHFHLYAWNASLCKQFTYVPYLFVRSMHNSLFYFILNRSYRVYFVEIEALCMATSCLGNPMRMGILGSMCHMLTYP